MQRHYPKTKLYPNSKLTLDQNQSSIWELPPYLIAQFGGELSRVMLEAAQEYIFQTVLAQEQKVFRQTAFSSSILPNTEFSENSNKNVT